MSVLVRIGRKKAILCSGKWTSADPRLEEQLQAALDIWIHKSGGPPIGHTDPDHFAAHAIQAESNYEIVLSSKPRRTLAKNAYLAKRQIRLPFF